MKRIIIFLIISISIASSNANNLQLGALTISDPTHVQFTIQWDNSWKVSSGPANWDAVWIFIKYQDCSTNYLPWQHVGLSTTSGDHNVTGGILQVESTSDGKGVFIRRIANGSGNISSATVTLKMNITDATYNYQLNGVEMIYIPQGDFSVGDGNRGASALYGFTGDGAMAPKLINAAVQAAGLTAAQYLSNITWGSTAALPTTFPLGYNGFYSMKYEISQEEYVAFLNTLTYDQQTNRFAASPNSTAGTFVLAGSPNPAHCRNGIKIKTPGTVNNIPAVVGCDLNLNGTFDEADDGKDVACNWLNWADLIAYLDWAALRPMTEFEYEKICRGTATPVINEYVWGTTTITATNSGGIAYPGAVNEISLTIGTGLCAYAVGVVNNRGPLRCGFAATSVTNRAQAGAAFYGAMDMAGNVFEQCIGGMSYNYSSFTNLPGDGNLTATGVADTPNWPPNGGGNAGGILRGGNWYDNGWQYCITSNRDWLNNAANAIRDYRVGGRGVRTF
ncbi:MAG: SUMF1/EgtB/PvdO family nonheme iron enzyme [Tenuifilaceae bacterium]